MTPLMETAVRFAIDRANLSLAALLVAALAPGFAEGGEAAAPAHQTGPCAGDNGGLTLPEGFCATIFADGAGFVFLRARL